VRSVTDGSVAGRHRVRPAAANWPSTVAWAAPTSPGLRRRQRAGHPGLAGAITGVSREKVQIAREFADNADKTRASSMIIIGAAMNHWYHMDMNYRGSSTC
jgi:nitrate reductase alpha subunit